MGDETGEENAIDQILNAQQENLGNPFEVGKGPRVELFDYGTEKQTAETTTDDEAVKEKKVKPPPADKKVKQAIKEYSEFKSVPVPVTPQAKEDKSAQT